MKEFSYKFMNAKTGRLNTGRIVAYDQEEFERILQEKGHENIQDLNELSVAERPATEAQLAYLAHLGGNSQEDITLREASDMITNLQENRKPAEQKDRNLAHYYKIPVTRYTNKDAIYRLITQTLTDPKRDVDLIQWYLYRVYRNCFDRNRAADFSHPKHPALKRMATELATDKSVTKSIRTEANKGETFRWFGTFTTARGSQYSGASRATLAYRVARKMLVEQGHLAETDVPRVGREPFFERKREPVPVESRAPIPEPKNASNAVYWILGGFMLVAIYFVLKA